jgi:hypothetical protein
MTTPASYAVPISLSSGDEKETAVATRPLGWQQASGHHVPRLILAVVAAVISPRPGRIGDPALLKQSRAAVKRTNARLIRVRPMGALMFSCENTERDLILTFLLVVSGKI